MNPQLFIVRYAKLLMLMLLVFCSSCVSNDKSNKTSVDYIVDTAVAVSREAKFIKKCLSVDHTTLLNLRGCNIFSRSWGGIIIKVFDSSCLNFQQIAIRKVGPAFFYKSINRHDKEFNFLFMLDRDTLLSSYMSSYRAEKIFKLYYYLLGDIQGGCKNESVRFSTDKVSILYTFNKDGRKDIDTADAVNIKPHWWMTEEEYDMYVKQ